MDLTSIPSFEAVPFASGAGAGYRNTIPVPSQIGTTPGAASYTDGFPPVTFLPIASGGVPPSGADFNGILFAYSQAIRWEQAGGNYPFNAAFASTIAGYPKGAIVLRSDSKGQWLNTVDGNTTDPDSGTAAGWIALRANTGTSTIVAVAGAIAPTPTQLGAQVLQVTGTLTGNASLTLPLTAGAQWVVVNKTTGAFTLTVQGASGAGVSIAQGVGQLVYTDGTNYYSTSASVSGQYLPIDGTAVAATRLATPRAFAIGGTGSVITASAVNFDGTGNVTLKADVADGALSIAKTNNLQSTLDAKAALAGAAFTGSSSIADTGANTDLALNKPASGKQSRLVGQMGGANRWSVILGSAESETGSNAGSNFAIVRYSDAGAFVDNAVLISRANGAVTIAGSVTSAGGFQNSDRRLKKNIKRRPVQRGLRWRSPDFFVSGIDAPTGSTTWGWWRSVCASSRRTMCANSSLASGAPSGWRSTRPASRWKQAWTTPCTCMSTTKPSRNCCVA